MDQLLKDHVHFTDEVVKLQAAFIAGYLTAIKGLLTGHKTPIANQGS